jgi:hypothetical protein
MTYPLWAFLALLLAVSGSQTSPTLPGGAIVAWIICNGRKRNPIGGWLLFYYWQVCAGVLVGALLFSMNIQSYVRENFEDSSRYWLFLASATPALVFMIVQLIVATFLLIARTWDMLRLMRWVLAAGVAVAVLGGVIDFRCFPDNLAFSIIGAASDVLWLAYFFRSERVRHVFILDDWDAAVNVMYPLKLKRAS